MEVAISNYYIPNNDNEILIKKTNIMTSSRIKKLWTKTDHEFDQIVPIGVSDCATNNSNYQIQPKNLQIAQMSSHEVLSSLYDNSYMEVKINHKANLGSN